MRGQANTEGERESAGECLGGGERKREEEGQLISRHDNSKTERRRGSCWVKDVVGNLKGPNTWCEHLNPKICLILLTYCRWWPLFLFLFLHNRGPNNAKRIQQFCFRVRRLMLMMLAMLMLKQTVRSHVEKWPQLYSCSGWVQPQILKPGPAGCSWVPGIFSQDPSSSGTPCPLF